MRNFTTKGLVWLILGAMIVAAAFPPDDLTNFLGMILIGVTFIAVYFIKQIFDPRRIGWFIGGGMMTAFTVETLFEYVFKYDYTSDIATVLIGLIVACVCFFMFYLSNKKDIDDVVEDMEDEQLARYAAKERAVRGSYSGQSAETERYEEEPGAGSFDAPVVEVYDGGEQNGGPEGVVEVQVAREDQTGMDDDEKLATYIEEVEAQEEEAAEDVEFELD